MNRRLQSIIRSAWTASRVRAVASLLLAIFSVFSVGCASHHRNLLKPRSSDAEALLQEAKSSQSPEPYYQLALLHYANGSTDTAVEVLQKALQREELYEPALTLLSKLFHTSGRSFEGIDFFAQRPLTEWPESVRVNIALLHGDVGNTEEARVILSALQTGKHGDMATVNLAYLDLVDEENARARVALERAIQRYKDSPEILNNLAIARMRAGDVDGSAKILQNLVAKHENFAPAQFNLALLLRHYLFDENGAQRAEMKFDDIGAPQLSDAMIDALLDPQRIENAAPPVPIRKQPRKPEDGN